MTLDEWLASNTLKSNGGSFAFENGERWKESLQTCGHLFSDVAAFQSEDPYCGTVYCGTCFRNAVKTLSLTEARNHEEN